MKTEADYIVDKLAGSLEYFYVIKRGEGFVKDREETLEEYLQRHNTINEE